ncbi:MAG: hypothetical protein QOE36_3116 [Gaiellaceae bacterium]|nr:hypothetical protein [Gaiellaceae bacterium]
MRATDELSARAVATAEPLAALWGWLATWIAADGGVNGPVVHRADLKRLFATHDTPWTQHAVIAGLLHLHRRSGNGYWLERAIRLGDAQCSRQEPDGRFRWAGHEDDRFSSLVSNALASRALLDLAAAADRGQGERYLAAAERNLEEYVVGCLYRPELGGFAVAQADWYAGRDRFVVNMNAVAVDALLELDRQRSTDRHAGLARTVGERILSLETPDGPPYSDLEPALHIPLYTALGLRGVRALAELTGDPVWREVAQRAVAFLDRLEDAGTALWSHKLERGEVSRCPVFVAGGGMICNGLLDAAALTGAEPDVDDLAARLLRFQHRNGAIRNFAGYDGLGNGARRGHGRECWEDVVPTPSWNAQAFHFLARVLPPPQPPVAARPPRIVARSPRFVYVESERVSAVCAWRPVRSALLAVFPKRRRHALVVPAPHAVARAIARKLRLQ